MPKAKKSTTPLDNEQLALQGIEFYNKKVAIKELEGQCKTIRQPLEDAVMSSGRETDKGSKVLVKGRIQTGSYEKDGRTIYTTDVIADNYGGVEFLSAKSQETTPTAPEAPAGFSAMQDEEIPF